MAPRRSTCKIHRVTATDLTYALTTGGHNAGIVSEARHPGRSYQIATKRATDKYEDLDTWLNKCLEGRRFLVPGVGAMAGRGLATILIVVFALMAVDESGPRSCSDDTSIAT